jgi:hypothetical protein
VVGTLKIVLMLFHLMQGGGSSTTSSARVKPVIIKEADKIETDSMKLICERNQSFCCLIPMPALIAFRMTGLVGQQYFLKCPKMTFRRHH